LLIERNHLFSINIESFENKGRRLIIPEFMGKRRQHIPGDPDILQLSLDVNKIRNQLKTDTGCHWVSYSMYVPDVDPLACIEQLSDSPDLFYWEHPQTDFAIASGGSLVNLKATGSNRFGEINEQSKQLRKRILSISEFDHNPSEPVLVGGYSFSDHNVHRMWKNFGASHFSLPEWHILKAGNHVTLTLTVSAHRRNPESIISDIQNALNRFTRLYESIKSYQLPEIQSTASKPNLIQTERSFHDWNEQVNKCKRLIENGTFEKIVIARKLDVKADKQIPVPRVLYYLRQQFPECFIFMIKIDQGPSFIGATPERLVSLKRNMMMTEGLAGSISRGDSASEDVALGHSLLESKKDRSEHDFVVKDIQNNLKRHRVNAEYPQKPVIKKLSNVQHLYTPISAKVTDDISIHKLAEMLHPTPAVGGFPKDEAVPYINEIEEIDRGWYAGPIGWYNLDGSGEFAVAIRSAWILNQTARLFAGCGIVKNSTSENEWEETEMKLLPVLDALKQATKIRS
jgi:menaquinone-specific isochorismate synthase